MTGKPKLAWLKWDGTRKLGCHDDGLFETGVETCRPRKRTVIYRGEVSTEGSGGSDDNKGSGEIV